jgi:hypothetical protein
MSILTSFFNDNTISLEVRNRLKLFIREVVTRDLIDDPIINEFLHGVVIKRNINLRIPAAEIKGEEEDKEEINKKILESGSHDNMVKRPEIEEAGKESNKILSAEDAEKQEKFKLPVRENDKPKYFSKNAQLEVSGYVEFDAIPHVFTKKKNDKNPHQILHSQRQWLMNQAILKYYNESSLAGIKNKKIVAISPSSGLTRYLYPSGNYYINTAITGDPNDISRGVMTMVEIVSIKKDEFLNNWCSCYQEKEPCQHIKEFNPQLVLLPHSVYYLKDELINWFLDKGKDVIGTAHVYNPDTAGQIIDRSWRKIREEGDEKNKKQKYKGYVISEYSEENGQVTMDIKDDKVYHHRNFMPALYNTSNITTQTTTTRVHQRFRFQNMDHISFQITGIYGMANDFNSYISSNRAKNPILITSSSKLETVSEQNVGNYYIKEVGEDGDKMLIRILDSKVETFHVRSRNTSLLNILFHWGNGNLMDRDFYRFVRQFKFTQEGGILNIENDAYNNIYLAAMAVTKYDYKNLLTLYQKAVAIIGRKMINIGTIYTLVKTILRDVVKTKLMVLQLSETRILKDISEFPYKKSIPQKIFDFLVSPLELDSDLNIKKEVKTKVTYTKSKLEYPKFRKIKKEPEELEREHLEQNRQEEENNINNINNVIGDNDNINTEIITDRSTNLLITRPRLGLEEKVSQEINDKSNNVLLNGLLGNNEQNISGFIGLTKFRNKTEEERILEDKKKKMSNHMKQLGLVGFEMDLNIY